MDIVAGLLTTKAEEERKLAELRGGTSSDGGGFVSRQLRRTGLSKAQALSSLASLADWITDFQYYFEVRSWTEGRYAPSSDDTLDCADFLMSEGRFVNGIWEWDCAGLSAVVNESQSCGVIDTCASNLTDVLTESTAALMAECRRERTVDVPEHVMLWLLASAWLGLIGDVLKAISTAWEGVSGAARGRSYARQDKRHAQLHGTLVATTSAARWKARASAKSQRQRASNNAP